MYRSQEYEELMLENSGDVVFCDESERVSNEKLYLVEPELHEDKKVPFINFNIESSALVDDLASGFDEIEYDVSNNLGQARKLLLEVSEFYSHKSIVGDDLTVLSEIRNLALTINDIANSRYNNSDGPFKDNYGSGRTAIVHKTNCSRPNADSSILRGKLYDRYPSLLEAVTDNMLTPDHVNILSTVMASQYDIYLDRDIDLLVDASMKFSVHDFKNIVKHWKNNVDDQLEKMPDEFIRPEDTYLNISQLSDGNYYINGILHKTDGMILKKALTDIENKLWRADYNNTSCEVKLPKSTLRAQAVSYLAQNYITKKDNSINGEVEFSMAPTMSADIIIDIEDVRNNNNTQEYLFKTLNSDAPIFEPHSQNELRQVLCDCELETTLLHSDGNLTVGDRMRTAPTKYKKVLAKYTNSCIIDGCDAPVSWCDAHHIKHWIDGGETSIENLVLICRHHHRKLHYDQQFEQDAKQQFIKHKEKHKNRHHEKQKHRNKYEHKHKYRQVS